MNSCLHINEVIDQHEGFFVCVDCGYVKDSCFSELLHSISDKNVAININTFGETENILEQFHVPEHFSQIVNSKNKKTSNVKKIISNIYNSVNEFNSNILLKDIANFSNLLPNQIKSKDVLIVNLDDILEKYTKKFDLSFKTYSIIKEKISQFNNTGYQPLTIIAGLIYLYHISIKKRLSMRTIALTLGISSISIQRFTKKYQNAFSSRN